MIKVVYNRHYSRDGGSAKKSPQWKYTFYSADKPIAYMTPVARTDQIWVEGETFACKRLSRYYSFNQLIVLEGKEKTLVTSTHNMFSSRWWLNFAELERELYLRLGWTWVRYPPCQLFDAEKEIGRLVRGNRHNNGATIDLPREIPLAQQIFIFRIAQFVWQRGSSWSG